MDRKTYYEYSEFIQRWQWQWFATLTFKQDLWKKNVCKNWHRPCDKERFTFGLQTVNSFRLAWTLELCLKEKIQVGYFYVLDYRTNHPHLHLLMLGQGNKKDSKRKKNLLDVNPKKWQDEWPFLAKIDQIDSIEKPCYYLADLLRRYDQDQIEYDIYNKKLLKKLNKKHLSNILNGLAAA